MRLIISGKNIELSEKTKISQTFQVNDILTLSNRQSNYTNTFSIPKTANNIEAFGNLGIVGNNSNTPYQRNECFLYSESEECLIYSGFALVKDTGDNYKVNVYDGNIDLYKAIENKTIGEMPLTEINHLKNLTTVVDSWQNDLDYKYIVADYNGKTLYDTNKINIDYLVPSVKVSYLMDKIAETFGFVFESVVFNTFNYDNLWLTYPKGILANAPAVEVFNLANYDFTIGTVFGSVILQTYTIDSNYLFISNNRNIVFSEAGNYKIDISANFKFLYTLGGNYAKLLMARNTYESDLSIITNFTEVIPFHFNENRSNELIINVEENETIFFYVELETPFSTNVGDTSLDIVISKVNAEAIDFEQAFIDLKIKDFISEILNRFALTPFKNKYSNVYEFKTLFEIFQDTNVVDWSQSKSKFQSIEKESYIYGSYSQQNNFRYKYNEENSEYYDGSISIDNVNLQASKTAVSSIIYAPEKARTNDLFKPTNVYKLWNKEIKDDGNVNYKALDKRFYLMRYNDFVFSSTKTAGSESLGAEQLVNVAPYETFFGLSFNDIIQDYYSPISQILDKSIIVTVKVYLTDLDIQNIDFSRLYWIEELSNYFLLNKISNYQGAGVYNCEMIKINYTLPEPVIIEPQTIELLSLIDGCLTFTPDYDGLVKIQISLDGGVTFADLGAEYGGGTFSGVSPICGITLPEDPFIVIRLVNALNEVISNNLEIGSPL